MTKVIREAELDDSAVDPIQAKINKIKEAKRLKMKEAAELSEDNKPQTEDDTSADNSKIEAGKGKYSDDKKHIGDSTDEWVYEDEEVDGTVIAEEDEVIAEEDEQKTDDKDEATIAATASKVSQSVGQGARDTDNVAADNAKIQAGNDVVDNPDAVSKNVSVKEDSKAGDTPSGELPPTDVDNKGNSAPKVEDGEEEAEKIIARGGDDTSDVSEKPEDKLVTKEDFDIDADVAAITEDEDLTEAQKSRIRTVYEAALVTKANEVINEALEIMRQDIVEYKEKLHEEFADKINDYLTVVVEEWTADNKVALVEQARHETTDGLMSDLRTVFESWNFQMPEGKADLFEKVLEENIALEDKVNELLAEKVERASIDRQVQKDGVLAALSEGLSVSQKTKLKMLAETVDFTSEDEYAGKIQEIKSSFFAKPKKGNLEKQITPVELHEEVKKPDIDDGVAAVVGVIDKLSK